MNLFELAVVISAVDKATSVIKGVDKALSGVGAAGEKLKSVGQSALIGGAAMTAAGQQMTGAIVGAVNACLEPAGRLEDALAKVGSVVTPMSGSVEDAMARTKAAALDWSKVHTGAADKFVDTTYMMISAGLNEQAAVEATRTAMLTAKATMGDATEAAALVATAYNNMGDKAAPAATEIGRLGDVITKTQQNYQFANLGQLAAGLTFGIPAAKAAKLSFEQLSNTIGALNSAGLGGSMAGTAFASVLSKIDNAGTKLGFTVARAADGTLNFNDTLHNMEQKFGSLKDLTPEVANDLREAFGDEGFRAISLMLGKSQELAKGLDTVKNSAGAAAAATQLIEGTRSGQLEILNNRIDAIKVSVADKLQPALSTLGGNVATVVEAFGKWLEQNPQVIQIFADATSELGQWVAALVPKLLAVLQSVGKWMTDNSETTKTIIKIVAAVAALMAVLGPLVLVFGGVAMFAGQALSLASGIGSMVSALWGLVPALISGAATAWAFAAALLANPITWIVLGIIAAAALIYVYWDPIAAFFQRLWAGIKAGFDKFAAAFMTIWTPVVGFFLGIWEDIKHGFQLGFVAGVLNVLKYLSPIYWIVRAFTAVVSWMSTFNWKVIGGYVVDGLLWGLKVINPLYWLTLAFMAAWNWLSTLNWRAIGSSIVDGLLFALKVINPLYWMTVAFMAAWNWLTSLNWSAIGTGIVNGIMGALSTLGSLVQAEFNGVVQLFYESGQRMITTLVDGIKAVAQMPVDAVTGIVQRVRNLLPFSPAKDGPLSDLDRIRLVETIADTVKPEPLVKAMTSVAAATSAAAAPAAMTTMPVVNAPRVSDLAPAAFTTMPVMASLPGMLPLPVPQAPAKGQTDAGGSTGANAMPSLEVHIHLGAGTDGASAVATLEQWVRANGGPLYQAVMAEAKRQSRGSFSG